MPPPFDITTSHALALNCCAGQDAEQMFRLTRAKTRTTFRIQIHEVVDGSDVPGREVVDTTCTTLPELLMIVEDLVLEMEAPEEESHGK